MDKPLEHRALTGSRVRLDHPLMTDEDALTGLIDERPEAWQTGDFLKRASPLAMARFFATVHELVLDIVDCKADASSDPDNARSYSFEELQAMRQTARIYREALTRLSGTPHGHADSALMEQYEERRKRETALSRQSEAEDAVSTSSQQAG